jgi:formylglycine-generating enzyme required for sulfatase activity
MACSKRRSSKARGRRTSLLAGPLFGVALSACSSREPEVLPPLGEVIIAVDTDVPVPSLAGRLRVDLFTKEGTWFQSRDIARTNAVDWPLSFSVYSDDLHADKVVLVRLRAYPEGAVRDYRGERFAARTAYAPRTAAKSLRELCSSAPELAVGEELILRRGRDLLTGYVPDGSCTQAPLGGSVAAKVQITTAGAYRLGSVATFPAGIATSVFLRTRCEDPASQIACAGAGQPTGPGGVSFNVLSSVSVRLDPGTYYLLSGGYDDNPADVTLQAVAESAGAPLRASDAAASPSPEPRYFEGGRDITRSDEPEPRVAIDRLLLVRVRAGVVAMARVTLRGACLGTMARLSQAGSFHDPVIDEAETCVGAEAIREPLREEPLGAKASTLGQSVQGTFPGGGPACPAGAAGADPVCIPAGIFRLGSPIEGPERAAVMGRFWMDRNEVTVGRWRAAMDTGFRSPDATPLENNAALATSSRSGSACSWSVDPRSGAEARESFALSCVSWNAARAFCRFNGGDLPTEAQWTYAATVAGREHQTAFPWGGEASLSAPCSRAVFGRNDTSPSGPTGPEVACLADGYGPLPVNARAGIDGDVTPTYGIIGLGGGVGEWTLDAYQPYASACWNAVSLRDPACLEDDAPARSALGRGWADALGDIRLRKAHGRPATPVSSVGFRCAYVEETTR